MIKLNVAGPDGCGADGLERLPCRRAGDDDHCLRERLKSPERQPDSGGLDSRETEETSSVLDSLLFNVCEFFCLTHILLYLHVSSVCDAFLCCVFWLLVPPSPLLSLCLSLSSSGFSPVRLIHSGPLSPRRTVESLTAREQPCSEHICRGLTSLLTRRVWSYLRTSVKNGW